MFPVYDLQVHPFPYVRSSMRTLKKVVTHAARFDIECATCQNVNSTSETSEKVKQNVWACLPSEAPTFRFIPRPGPKKTGRAELKSIVVC